jgi:transposase
MRDEFGAIFADAAFASLFPTRGQPAEAPWRLALVTIMQYIEDLSDRRAADAVRSRIDWKYALSLELTDTGFDSTVLSEFCAGIVKLLGMIVSPGNSRHFSDAIATDPTLRRPALYR